MNKTEQEVVVKPARAKPVRRATEHYVNNKEFSQAVVNYVNSVREAQKNDTTVPRIPEYIGRCFLKISEGLSHKPNFVRYTYREEMVMDAVENCIKAIMNYNVEAATRTGSPNAFAYFTQICYYAFIRRILKEKKQQDIKFRYIEFAGLEDFITNPEGSDYIEGNFIDVLKTRIDKVKKVDRAIKDYKKKEAKNLETFMKE
jgi:hypothetical protein